MHEHGAPSEILTCCFVDGRAEFFAIVAQKLGSEFRLFAGEPNDTRSFAAADVVIAPLPGLENPHFQTHLARLQKIVRLSSGTPVVVFLSTSDRQVKKIAVAAGAYDLFIENGSLEELRHILRRAAQYRELALEVERLRSARGESSDFACIVGTDEKMRAVFTLASKVAPTDANLLISGESGTGKELVARAVHDASPRANAPFVAVACSSLPESLIEAELFGHEKGAFTGANSTRVGRFEAAANGTVFLDEIGELSQATQVKLLRVLQERTFERLGSNQPRPMRARVICATNRDLNELVGARAFRLDLYYRLNTVEITLPPLRQRRCDIPILAYTFLETFTQRHGRPARRISPAAMSALEEHAWPGNVRELQNVIESAVVIAEAEEIRLEHLPARMVASPGAPQLAGYEAEVRDFKRRVIMRALEETQNNKVMAARLLGISRSSLHRLIEELEIVARLPRPRRSDEAQTTAPAPYAA